MVVLILERVAASVRGELTRWMLEPHAGVFVGRLSARVRDTLWEQVCAKTKGGAAILVFRQNTEQGYGIRYWGRTTRRIEDHEGLQLVRHVISSEKSK